MSTIDRNALLAAIEQFVGESAIDQQAALWAAFCDHGLEAFTTEALETILAHYERGQKIRAEMAMPNPARVPAAPSLAARLFGYGATAAGVSGLMFGAPYYLKLFPLLSSLVG